jgi:hypothetical protein
MSATFRESPYQGLMPFDVEDAPYFFGRDRDTRLISADLFAAPLTILYGASGVGKSSVLRAGVIPRLRQRSDVLPVLFNEWQSDPLGVLTSRIEKELRAVDAPVPQREPSFAKWLQACARESKRTLMLILDQFEEYSLYHPTDDAFAQQFPAAARLDDLSAGFIVSLREDAMSRLDRFEGRIPSLFRDLRRIDHLDRSAAREAIEKPLAKYNEQFGKNIAIEPALINAVIEDVQVGKQTSGTGGLAVSADEASRIETAVLQLVMSRIWKDEQRNRSDKLRLTTYQSVGANRIVQQHLEEVMSQLASTDLDIAATVFQRLVTRSGAKFAHTAVDLADEAGVDPLKMKTILDTLAGGRERILRLVAPLPDRPNEPRYEIFHDKLAQAILDWRTRHLEQTSVDAAAKAKIEQRESSVPISAPAPVKTRHGKIVGEPPDYAEIAGLVSRNKVLIVVGSGASASDRTIDEAWTPGSPAAPTGAELKRYLARDIDFPEDEIDATPFAALASYYASVTSRSVLNERLKKVLAPLKTPTLALRWIAEVAKTTPLTILTTTFDTLTETAFDLAHVQYDFAYNASDPATEGGVIWRVRPGEFATVSTVDLPSDESLPSIFKLFGSAEEGDLPASFIVTEEDDMRLFSRISQGNLPRRILKDIRSKHILFIGMGLGSWPQRLLVSKLREQSGLSRGTRRGSRGWSIASGVSPLDRMRWSAARVDVFDHDIDEFARAMISVMGLAL